MDQYFDFAKQLIENCKHPMLTTHRLPDGDAIGSSLALNLALQQKGKQTTLVCQDIVPEVFTFLPGVNDFQLPYIIDSSPIDLILIIDVAMPHQIEYVFDTYKSKLHMSPIINIDHHEKNTYFGHVNIVDENFPSCAEIILEFLDYLNIDITVQIAEALLVGILTDTRYLQTPNTISHSFNSVARLIEAGANISTIHEKLANTPARMKYISSLLAEMSSTYNDQLVWISIRQQQVIAEWSSGLSGELASMLSNLNGVRVAIVFFEESDGSIKVSLRSKFGMELPDIVGAFGGGGNRFTAGCRLPPMKLIDAVNQVLPKIAQYFIRA